MSANTPIVLCFKGNYYIFKHDGTEDKKILNDRAWWILKNMNTKVQGKEQDIRQIINLSKVAINIMHYNVEYDEKTTKQLLNFKEVYEKV
jgi:hypothetical protein